MIAPVTFTVPPDMAGAVYDFILDERERRKAAATPGTASSISEKKRKTPALSTADLDQRDRQLAAHRHVDFIGGGEMGVPGAPHPGDRGGACIISDASYDGDVIATFPVGLIPPLGVPENGGGAWIPEDGFEAVVIQPASARHLGARVYLLGGGEHAGRGA